MRRIGKIAVKIAGICLAAGCILLIISIAMGADLSIAWNGLGLRGWHHRWDVFEEDWEDWEDEWHGGRHGGEGYWGDLGDSSLVFDPREVDKIQIDFDCGGVRLVSRDVTEIQVYTNEEIRNFSARQEDEKLILQHEGRKEEDAKMLILIPQDMELAELDAQVRSGMLTAQNMNVEYLNLDVGAGFTEFYGSVGKDCSAKTSAGAIELHVEGQEEDFNYSVQSDIGQISINGSEFGGLGFHQTLDHEGAVKKMNLECSVGSIDVTVYSQ